MRKHWSALSSFEAQAFEIALAFTDGRLSERATVEWALSLSNSGEDAKRLAVLWVLDRSSGTLAEPWATTWRLIEESWESGSEVDDNGVDAVEVANRIAGGDRSGALVDKLVNLVRPRLKVSAPSGLDRAFRRAPRNPRSPLDLASLSITSGRLIDPKEIGLESISDGRLLVELAQSLDAAVLRGLSLAERVFGSPHVAPWRLGDLRRVYFVEAAQQPPGEHEPDAFHQGIAPAVKLLHAVVVRLCFAEPDIGKSLARRFGTTPTFVHRRLWAALARNPDIASHEEVEEFISSTSDREFWDLHAFPEVAELRATRYSSLSKQSQDHIRARLRKGPPRSHWPAGADRIRVKEARAYWVLRELLRLQVGGAHLPSREAKWVLDHVDRFADLKAMSRIDEGFLGTMRAEWVAPDPDERFTFVEGTERLRALEAALAMQKSTWDEDPARRAADWIRAPSNLLLLVEDFVAASATATDFPHVLSRFAWEHTPVSAERAASEISSEQNEEAARRFLTLVPLFSDNTVAAAIDGLTRWMDTWASAIGNEPDFELAWMRVWPDAVSATNAQQPADAEPSLSIVAMSGDREPQDLDTLNTPTGRMVGAFLSICPDLEEVQHPFEDGTLMRIRDAALATPGRSRLIVHHRLIEHLAYFLIADDEWTKRTLLAPLLADTSESVFLWRAVARKTRYTAVLKIIGEEMVKRVVDPRLGRESRRSLVFSLAVEALHAFNQQREPAVPMASIQQVLRALDDEVRVHAAGVVQRFVRDISKQESIDGMAARAGEVFRRAAKPFLTTVWPQDLALTTPGVSRALARLPAEAGEAFVEAVQVIEPFLVPFSSWSLIDYGLRGSEDGAPKLARIDNPLKAQALLRLLNATIAVTEGLRAPSDLGAALEQIRTVAPRLESEQAYRRLSALERR